MPRNVCDDYSHNSIIGNITACKENMHRKQWIRNSTKFNLIIKATKFKTQRICILVLMH